MHTLQQIGHVHLEEDHGDDDELEAGVDAEVALHLGMGVEDLLPSKARPVSVKVSAPVVGKYLVACGSSV